MRTPEIERNRVGWWAFVLLLLGAAAFIAHSFVGILVLGTFGYYATRPISNRIEGLVDSKRISATITALVVLTPVLLLLAYAGLRIFTQVQQAFEGTGVTQFVARFTGLAGLPDEQRGQLLSIVQDPASLLGGSGGSFWSQIQPALQAFNLFLGGLLLISLSVTLTYVLLLKDEEVANSLVELAGGSESTAYAYGVAVDTDLESVFFGNLLFAALMSVVATVTYYATNLVAPGELHIPMVLVLGFLTGVTSLIPIVVGKLVYIPVVAYLGFQATQSGSASLTFVGLVLVAYFLVLDILPQSVLQPYVSGGRINPLVLLFGYILGPMLFGWYGFFFLPIVFVLMLEAYRIVLPELIHGEPMRPEATVAEDAGTDPQEAREERGDLPEGETAERTEKRDGDSSPDAS
jgi:predicted PurR-regulated permease PerM